MLLVQLFAFLPRYPEEDAKILFPCPGRRSAGELAIVSLEEFRANFDAFTEGSLRFLDWRNVIVAGGAVMACLTTRFNSNRHRRATFHDGLYSNADIDVFIHGLDEAQGFRKLEQVYSAVCEAIPCPGECAHAVGSRCWLTLLAHENSPVGGPSVTAANGAARCCCIVHVPPRAFMNDVAVTTVAADISAATTALCC